MEDTHEKTKPRASVRRCAAEIKGFHCKNLIAVLENPADIKNIGTVIRNVNALGVEKVYVVDPRRALPDDWQELRERRAISKISVSAVKWTFVKRFDSTDECFDYLEKKNFRSIVTSPHVKGKASTDGAISAARGRRRCRRSSRQRGKVAEPLRPEPGNSISPDLCALL